MIKKNDCINFFLNITLISFYFSYKILNIEHLYYNYFLLLNLV